MLFSGWNKEFGPQPRLDYVCMCMCMCKAFGSRINFVHVRSDDWGVLDARWLSIFRIDKSLRLLSPSTLWIRVSKLVMRVIV